MAWVAVSRTGEEYIFNSKPYKVEGFHYWLSSSKNQGISLPYKTIEKIIGKELSWDDEPVELK